MLLDEKQKPIQLPSTTRHAQLIRQTQHAEQDPGICCHILTRENGYNQTEPKHHTLYTGFLQNILLAWFEPSSITETISSYVRIQDLVELYKALQWAFYYMDVPPPTSSVSNNNSSATRSSHTVIDCAEKLTNADKECLQTPMREPGVEKDTSVGT
jgi:hypothetical protein